uniref:Aminodehydroquinate synthase n=1 Tax=Streptomyces collinus TaxID=42684 RepID=Q9X649_STRCU|nr:aminodehydroquinate synthase [Streptomyces collinus]
MTRQVPVRFGDRSYDVLIGPGVRSALPGIIGRLGARRVAVVSARPPEWVPDTGAETLLLPARDGEPDTDARHGGVLCAAFVRFGLTRSDAVVSVGGGTTTDVVGLAAALYHRGIPVVHLPTTLLAQVDASVGGKTAVNLPEGKNLVGAYWQPAAVLCDTDYLTTLPPRELRNGLGEIARCHFIGAPGLHGLPLAEQIAASVTLKAGIVSADERDTGLRHLLNYGHTLGHALEAATGFALRHGEGVAIGTVFAGLLAGLLGRIGPDRVSEHRAHVASYGVPTALPDDADPGTLIEVMRRDEKARSGLTFCSGRPVRRGLCHRRARAGGRRGPGPDGTRPPRPVVTGTPAGTAGTEAAVT